VAAVFRNLGGDVYCRRIRVIGLDQSNVTRGKRRVNSSKVSGLGLWFGLGEHVVDLQGAALAKLTWPSGDEADAGPVDLNEIYPELEKIPVNERAAVVTKRIKADLYASAPTSFLISLGIAFAFAFPIVVGTVIGYILVDRSMPGWVRALRYLIAWWTTSVFLSVALAFVVTALFPYVNVQGIKADVQTLISLGVMLLIVWVMLRRWKREPPVEESSG